MSSGSPIHQMVQSIILSEVDRFVNAKVQARRAHPAEEAFLDMLRTGSMAAADEIKDASFQFFENILTVMTLKGILDDFFIRNFER